MLLRAWPEIRRRTGARLVVAGADPLAVRLLLTRLDVSDEGIDVVGFLPQDGLTELLRSTKALVAPSLGGESFGMVLDSRLRLRDARRRLRHRRVPRGGDRRDRGLGAAGRRRARSSTASSASSPTSSGAWRWVRRRARTPSATTRGRTSRARLEEIYERVVGGRRGGEAVAA